MAMSDIQKAAWESANAGNSAFSATELGSFIVALIAVVMIAWFCWVVLGAFRAGGRANGNWGDVPVHIGRALMMLIAVLAIVTVS